MQSQLEIQLNFRWSFLLSQNDRIEMKYLWGACRRRFFKLIGSGNGSKSFPSWRFIFYKSLIISLSASVVLIFWCFLFDHHFIYRKLWSWTGKWYLSKLFLELEFLFNPMKFRTYNAISALLSQEVECSNYLLNLHGVSSWMAAPP